MAVWIFTQKILAGEPIQVFNHGRMRRDFTYIDDIVSGLLSCLDSPPHDDGTTQPGGSKAPHRIYNIGNNQAEELMWVVELIELACGKSARTEYLPLQPGDVQETFADIEPIQKDFGFRPLTRIDDGIPSFVEWYRRYAGQ